MLNLVRMGLNQLMKWIVFDLQIHGGEDTEGETGKSCRGVVVAGLFAD